MRRLAIVVLLLLVACKKEPVPAKGKKTGRTQPICATQDCSTHTIVDDGCADDGRCLSCVVVCPSDVPSATP